ncbi:hypothetical protein ACP_2032 [Acidobacterium capsulatum ATCC 51196]|uniref:Uncharacterized protein n=1 Tax=Acidobacterium capsulatum (strain ATCC 51196 / DSM 11244 / BCRC 80197 / JCM 7670 / NBRC 15755 / NCIMB 13165 / 161) TaxID=240015 RepID=C1F8X1_ACIC5|nr:hypothetical protein ACP_2032 [Acidobacterium capsulatum ATCC 51196]
MSFHLPALCATAGASASAASFRVRKRLIGKPKPSASRARLFPDSPADTGTS